MSELISGKEALIALANGEEVEWRHPERDWFKAPQCNMRTQDFFSGVYQFRLKPRTITINGVEYIDKQGAYEAFMEVYNGMDIHPDI